MSTEQSVRIKQQGITPTHFTMIPNIAFQDLSPNAFKLLAVYLDMSKTGEIYAKNNTISERLGSSVNTMKRARKELADKKYILYSPGKDGKDTTTAKITVQVSWMWEENQRRLSNIDSPDTVSNSDSMVSNSDTPLSNVDTIKQELNKQELQKQKNNTSAEPQATSPTQENNTSKHNDWYDAVHDVLGVNGGLNALYQQMLQGKSIRKGYKEFNLDEPITPEQFRAWGKWYRKTVLNDNPDLSMVRDTAKIQSSIMEWLEKPKTALARPGDNFFQRKLPTNIAMLTIIPDEAVS